MIAATFHANNMNTRKISAAVIAPPPVTLA